VAARHPARSCRAGTQSRCTQSHTCTKVHTAATIKECLSAWSLNYLACLGLHQLLACKLASAATRA